MVKYIEVTEVAKTIRGELKAKFPGIKFSVRSDKYAGGSAIDVKWVDGPTEDSVQAVTDKFIGLESDPHTDSTHAVHATLPDGTKVRYGSDYVSVHRAISRTFLTNVITVLWANGDIKSGIKVVGKDDNAHTDGARTKDALKIRKYINQTSIDSKTGRAVSFVDAPVPGPPKPLIVRGFKKIAEIS